ncbi:hypothetical protein NLI96_g6361 [Meripilus lineatus]|uniref:Uncharacterized protein n=1 Tax=Meripilus lineatus TaxID=2056292 RepID=A0AAD5V302_9APHY|nr:hypothetical protein NLI96_g6361 [Physisporinus lineatus]
MLAGVPTPARLFREWPNQHAPEDSVSNKNVVFKRSPRRPSTRAMVYIFRFLATPLGCSSSSSSFPSHSDLVLFRSSTTSTARTTQTTRKNKRRMEMQRNPDIIITPVLPSRDSLPVDMCDALYSIVGPAARRGPRVSRNNPTTSRRKEQILALTNAYATHKVRTSTNSQSQHETISLRTHGSLRSGVPVNSIYSTHSYTLSRYSESRHQFTHYHQPTSASAVDRNPAPLAPSARHRLDRNSHDDWSTISVVDDDPLQSSDESIESPEQSETEVNHRVALEKGIRTDERDEEETVIEDCGSPRSTASAPAATIFHQELYPDGYGDQADSRLRAHSRTSSVPSMTSTQFSPDEDPSPCTTRRGGVYRARRNSTRRHAMYISANVWPEDQWRTSIYADSNRERVQKHPWRRWKSLKNAFKLSTRTQN